MNPLISNSDRPGTFELCFEPLFVAHRAYAFPCDASGHVDMDALDERIRDNYLYARAVVGFQFSVPKVKLRAC